MLDPDYHKLELLHEVLKNKLYQILGLLFLDKIVLRIFLEGGEGGFSWFTRHVRQRRPLNIKNNLKGTQKPQHHKF